MSSNEEIVAVLDDLRVAREKFHEQRDELIDFGRRNPTLNDDISRFFEAFNHYQDLADRARDAVDSRIHGDLPPEFLGTA